MDNGSIFLNKILSIVRARTRIGSLEISDTALRFAYLNGAAFESVGLRLPPGILENGEIKNYQSFVLALQMLRRQISDDFSRKRSINVMVTLSSVRIYSQAFRLPLVEGENLEEAIHLNIKMISPLELSQAYAGWQVIGQDRKESRLEVLSAFIGKTTVDNFRNALGESGFFPIAVESGALSLARLIRMQAVDFSMDRFYIVVRVDDRGLQFLVIRRGQLHFEYFNSWKDIQEGARAISWQDFEMAIKRNFHQVLNFYMTHWQEPVTEVLISAGSFEKEIAAIISENFSLAVKPIALRFDRPVPGEWFEAIGSALRAEVPRTKDDDINLFGVAVQDEFRRQQTLEFFTFWQILASSALGILLAAFLFAYLFLANINRGLESQLSFPANDVRKKEIDSLAAEIKEFNQSVAFIASIERAKSKTTLLDAMKSLASDNDIVLGKISLGSTGSQGMLSGDAKSQNQILDFKNAFAANKAFSSVNLPLSGIIPQGNRFSFAIDFKVNQ